MQTNEKTLQILKYLALGTAGSFALYAFLHKRNASLAGREYVSSNDIVAHLMPFVNVNPAVKPLVEKAARHIINELTGQREIIDVTPIKEEEKK